MPCVLISALFSQIFSARGRFKMSLRKNMFFYCTNWHKTYIFWSRFRFPLCRASPLWKRWEQTYHYNRSLHVDGKKTIENLEISLRVDRYVSRASNMKDFNENTNPNTFDNSTYQINVFLSIQIRIWLVKIVLITEPTSKIIWPRQFRWFWWW